MPRQSLTLRRRLPRQPEIASTTLDGNGRFCCTPLSSPLTQSFSTELFRKAFDHIAERIDRVYKDLTKGKAAPMGGVAYLNLEDSEEPYLSGVTFHAMPPMKRFRDMDQLSGGEKTVAALALLFAIHRWAPITRVCFSSHLPVVSNLRLSSYWTRWMLLLITPTSPRWQITSDNTARTLSSSSSYRSRVPFTSEAIL